MLVYCNSFQCELSYCIITSRGRLITHTADADTNYTLSANNNSFVVCGKKGRCIAFRHLVCNISQTSNSYSSVNAGDPGHGADENWVVTNTFWIPFSRCSNCLYSFSISSSRTRCVTMLNGLISSCRISSSKCSQYLWTGACPFPINRIPVCIRAPMLKWFVW